MSALAVVAIFLAAAGVLVVAGTSLARAGDTIAAATKLGGVWVGTIFIAAATSLPELVTDIAAVRLDAVDLAVGDLFGSSMANMLILAIVTILPAGKDLFHRAALEHSLHAAMAVILTCMAGAVLVLRPQFVILGVGPGSLLILITYVATARMVFKVSSVAKEMGAVAEMSGPEGAGERVLDAGEVRKAWWHLGLAALVILLVAPLFAWSAKELAELSGLGNTFVGTWLVGMSTSLPELVTSIAAVRMGAFDLAAGNLFGSNALNMSIFALLDLAHPGGPVLSAASQVHLISVFVAVILMSLGLAAIVYRAKRRMAMLEPSSGLMLLAYVVGLLLVYMGSTA